MKTGIKVADAMTKKPIIVDPETPIHECSKLMLKEKVGSLIVRSSSKAIGIISEKDIVERVVAKSLDPRKVLAKEIMSKRLITIKPHQDILEALQLMKIEKIRKLPVIDDEENFIGLLTTKDVLRLQPALIEIYLERLQIREHEDKLRRL